MDNKIITELVQFKPLDNATNEQIFNAVNNLNEFQQTLDGFIDAELIRETEEKSWKIIFHYENFEKVQAIGASLRSNKVFSEFTSLVQPGTLDISFYLLLQKW